MEELRALGVSLVPEGEKLRYRGGRGVVTAALLAKIRARKPELLELLQRNPEELDLADEPILETRTGLAAVRIRSRLLGCEIWLAHDERTAADLRAEMAPEQTLPVVLYDEIPKFRGKSPAMIRALFEVAKVFPGARLVQ